MLSAIGVTGAVSAWAGGYLGSFLPPPPRLLRAVKNSLGQRTIVADDGRYHLVLCGLEGDDAKEGTLRLLRLALSPQEYPMLRVTLSARCISLRKWYARKDETAGAMQAESVLREHNADAVLWGEAPKQAIACGFSYEARDGKRRRPSSSIRGSQRSGQMPPSERY